MKGQAGADAETPLLPGDRLDRYELLCPIASGGMASVWVARFRGKHGFEKLVAIKTILPQFADDARFRNMFLDEARILSQIHHVNVAQILDVGEERELIYLVMEYVDGDPLSKLLKAVATKTLPVPAGVFLRICADACAGLHSAHELRDKTSGANIGLVHRDVSPQNVLVTQEGAAKLIDFGIAKAKGRIGPDTHAGGVKGKLLYMPPEQASGKEVDRRADVWAVGAMMYGAYAGRTPYERDNEIDTLQALLKGGDPTPLPRASDIPGPIAEVVTRATRFDPNERYATALDLARALETAMAKIALPTSPTDVAFFIATHLAERATARRNTIDFALRAASDRERVRDVLAPVEGQARTDGLLAVQERILRDGLDSSLPPPPPAPPVTLGTADLMSVGGTVAESRPWPTRMVAPSSPPQYARPGSTEVLAPTEVPDLDFRPVPAKPPPPPRAPALPPPPIEIGGPPRPPPTNMIASAAGSIVGPDVLGPHAGHDELHSQEFLDPMAIAAKRAESVAPPRSAPPSRPASDHAPSAPPGGFLEARPVRAIVADVGAETRKERARQEQKSSHARLWLACAAALVAIAVTAFLVAPGFARRSAVAAAEEQGLTLGVEHVTVGFTSLHLSGVTLSAADLGGITLSAPEATIELHVLDPESIVVVDPSIEVHGASEDVESTLEKLRARASAASGKTKRLALQNAKVAWTEPLGSGSRLDADSVELDLVRGAQTLGDETHLTSPNTRLTTGRGVLGPWRVDGEKEPRNARVRIGFDPVLADGPSAMFVRSDNGTMGTLKIVRQPLTRLGLPAAFLGLAASDQTQIEAAISVSRPLPGRVAGNLALTVFDARLRADAAPLDVLFKAEFAGAQGEPLDVNHAALSFGPLVARVLGVVTLFDDAFKVDLKWNVPAMPCGVLLKKQSSAQASAAGLASFDSRHPDQASLTVTEAKTCGLMIFP